MPRTVYFDEPVRTIYFDEEPQTPLRTVEFGTEEEDDSILAKSLRSLGRGLTTGLAGAIELPGKISAIPTRLGLTEQSGEFAGADLSFTIAEKVRSLGPEKSEEGLGYGVLEGIGAIPGTVAKYAGSLAAGGPIGAAVAMGGIDLAEKLGETGNIGEAVKSGLIGTATGGALGLGARVASPLARAGIGAAAMGGASALEGASPQEAAMSALMGAGMGAAFRERVKAKTDAGLPEKSAAVEALKELAQKRQILEQEQQANKISRGGGDVLDKPAFKPPLTTFEEAGIPNRVSAPPIPSKPAPLPDKLTPGPDLKPRRGAENDFPINMTHMSDEPAIIESTVSLIRSKQDELNVSRGTKTLEEIRAESMKFGSPEEQARMQREFGESAPARMMAQKDILNTLTHDLEVLKQKRTEAARSGAGMDELDLLDNQARTATANAVAMMHVATSSRASWGRVGRVLSTVSRPADPAQRVIWELSKKGKLSDELMAAVMAAKDDPVALQGVLRTAANPKIMDKVYETWLNGILSGVKTHVVNTSSNALMQGLEGATRPLAAVNEAVGAALRGRPRERFVREVVADVRGLIDGAKAGIIAAKNALDGVYVGSGKLEHVHALPDKVLGVPTPGRMLQIEDEFFKALSSTREAYVQAYRTGRLAGKSHGDAMDAIPEVLGSLIPKADKKILGVFKGKNILENIRSAAESDKKMRMAGVESTPEGKIATLALEKGKELTFQKDAGRATKAFLALKETVPGLRYIVPFVQTPVNILKTAVEYSPAGAVKALKASGAETADLVAKMQIGALMSVPLIVEAYQGNITGSPRNEMPIPLPGEGKLGWTGGGPSDNDLKRNKQQTGWQPYSIAIDTGDGQRKYFSFERLEPFATILGLAADIGEARDEATTREKSAKLVEAISTNLTNKTFLQGMENLFKMTSDPYRWYDTVVRNYAGSVIPSLFGQAASAVDPNVRDVTLKREGGLVDTIANRIPGASQSLPARTSSTGQPVGRSGNAVTRGISPVAYSEDKPGMFVEKEFDRLKFVPDLPDRTIKDPRTGQKVDLTREELDLLAGSYRQAAQEVEKFMGNPIWGKIPDRLETGHDKVSIIKDIYSKYRRMAMSQIVANRLR